MTQTPTAKELLDKIVAAVGSVDEAGNASLSISFSTNDEAKSAAITVNQIKQKLKLIKQECNLVLSQIRLESPVTSDGVFISSLFTRHVGPGFEGSSRAELKRKKQYLVDFYKRINFMIDEVLLGANTALQRIAEYIKNDEARQ